MNLPVYVGYDPKESIAWHTMVQSLMENSSCPLAIHPVNISNYKKIFSRKPDPSQSNEFSFSRFLVPYLQNYEGIAVFMDCDMMLRDDIFDVLKEVNLDNAVSVVKHDYTPSDKVKFLNKVQYTYPRKNWSSFVVWNCSHKKNRKLTPTFIESASGLELHRFTWLLDTEIGDLNVRWNWLVGDYINPPMDVKNIHWTIGGPYFEEYSDVDFSAEWFEMNQEANFCKQRR